MLSTLNKCDTFLTISSQSSKERYFIARTSRAVVPVKPRSLYERRPVEQKAFVSETPARLR